MATNNNGRRMSTGTQNWANLRKKISSTDKQRLMMGKFLCIITGAGNGFGKAVANITYQDGGIFSKALAGSKVILIDNDEAGLRETSGKRMRQFLKVRKIDVEVMPANLSDIDNVKELIQKIDAKQDKNYEQVLLIQHASSLADVNKRLTEFDDIHEIHKFYALNLTARVYIAAQICKIFSSSKRAMVITGNHDLEKSVPYLGLNSMATFGIRSFVETFAKENPTVRTMYYTPMRFDSNKTKQLRENCGNSEIVKDEVNKLPNATDVAKSFAKLFEQANFKEGSVLNIDESDEKV